jgi:hypothetical protein
MRNMFRRALVLGLLVFFGSALVEEANACHRCHGRRGYYVSGCGYYCHGKGHGGGYRVVKVYRTVKVPVQTCSTTCATVVDPCNPCCTKTVPIQTCSTTYVTQRQLVHTQVVPRGTIYGNYTDGTRRAVVPGVQSYGGYRAPYRAGYGMGGGYHMGGYGAAVSTVSAVAKSKAIEVTEANNTNRVAVAF